MCTGTQRKRGASKKAVSPRARPHQGRKRSKEMREAQPLVPTEVELAQPELSAAHTADEQADLIAADAADKQAGSRAADTVDKQASLSATGAADKQAGPSAADAADSQAAQPFPSKGP